MNFKSLKVVLISLALSVSAQVVAEKMPESPKQKEIRIENDLNSLFDRATKAAAFKMDRKEDVRPFAIIKKKVGGLGVFELAKTDKNEKLTVNQMALSIRRHLTELAIAKEIDASVLVMYASVQPKGEEVRNGLSFEIEHIDGVSIMRFLPITEQTAENSEDNMLVLHIENMSTTGKPATVFTDMVRAVISAE